MAKQKLNPKISTENRIDYFKYALLALLTFLVVMLFYTKINGEDDIFWHLSTGKYIIENKTVPSSDVFGYVTEGMKWIPFEWGWDVISYQLYNTGGFTALYVFHVIVLLLIFGLLYLMLSKQNVNDYVSVLLLTILALGIKYRMGIKPQMFTYLFLVLILFLLINHKGSKILYAIPLIVLLWANLHMGVLAGVLLLGLYVLSELYLYMKNKNNQILTPILIFVLSLSAMLLNPNFIDTYLYAISHTQMKLIDEIYEWYSPFNSNFISKFYVLIYFVFLVIGFVSIFKYSKEKNFFYLLLILIFGIYSFKAVRFSTDFMLISFVPVAVFVSKYMKNIFANDSKSSVYYKTGIAGILILLLLNIPGGGTYKFIGMNSVFGQGIYEETFPVKMYNFAKNEKVNVIGTRPFQAFDNGGYFMWTFYGSKNFVDSRNLNDSIYFAFKNIFNKNIGFEKSIENYGIDYFILYQPLFLLTPNVMQNSIVSYLSSNPNWKLIYWDDKSFLFVKNDEKFKELINKYEYKYLTPYNLQFKRNLIQHAQKDDGERVAEEYRRKKQEEPESFLLTIYDKTLKKP